MKIIFGVEDFSVNEDFSAALISMKKLLKDGDESEIVYIRHDNNNPREVMARSYFAPQMEEYKPLKPYIWFNSKLMKKLKIKKEKIL